MKKNLKTLFISISLFSLGLVACNNKEPEVVPPEPPVEEKNKYTITWLNYNGDILEVDEDVIEGSEPSYDGETPIHPESEGKVYTFKGWSPSLSTVTENQTYLALYDSTQVVFAIRYTLNGGTNNKDNPSSYRVGSSFTFLPASKDGYTFVGWFNALDEEITSITPETTGEVFLNARYSPILNNLTVTSEDENKGTVSIVSGSGYSDESITVKAIPTIEYLFEGWYNGNTKVSDKDTYTFKMPITDYSLVAKFVFNEERGINRGVIPNFINNNKQVTYGLYPQTVVSDSDLGSKLNALTKVEDNGWYLYNDAYYTKLAADPYGKNYKFSNNQSIVKGNTYWFKCEPIKWNILSNENNEYLLLSTYVLDKGVFHTSQETRIENNYYVYPNSYEHSDIRAWLNGYDGSSYEVSDYTNKGFIDTAFYLDDSYIKTVTVDNSAETTNSPSNWYWCDDTEDKVFLLSYQDYMNTDYGFENTKESTRTRTAYPTDYAKARGIYYATSVYEGACDYWTRSPDTLTNGEYTSWAISYGGYIGFSGVSDSMEGIRPSFYLKTK